MKNYSKIFKWLMIALIVVSVVLLVLGFVKGFEANDGAATNVLLGWAYVVLGIALLFVVGVGLYVTATTNPKGLIKIGIAVLGAAVLFGLCYVLASGAPAVGFSGAKLPSATELKMTDTILNMAYIVGGAAILSIICGEVLMTIRNKK